VRGHSGLDPERGKALRAKSEEMVGARTEYTLPVAPRKAATAFTQVVLTLLSSSSAAGGSPFSAKRGRCRVAADGVRKAGMDRCKFAVTVVQSDSGRSKRATPRRRSPPVQPD